MNKNKSRNKSSDKKASRKSREAIIPCTIDAVVRFVSERYGLPLADLSGKRAPSARPQIGGPCIVVQAGGKDFVGVLPLAEKERDLRIGLMDIIERGELAGDVELLEEVSNEDIFKVVVEHTDLRGLRDWVSVNSNEEVMELMGNSAFWDMWNSCGLKPKVRLDGKDRICPSFSMMKELQAARLRRLLVHPAEYLLQQHRDTFPALNVVLQECRSFDWEAIVDELVQLLGGVEGWLEGACYEVTRGLVIYRL